MNEGMNEWLYVCHHSWATDYLCTPITPIFHTGIDNDNTEVLKEYFADIQRPSVWFYRGSFMLMWLYSRALLLCTPDGGVTQVDPTYVTANLWLALGAHEALEHIDHADLP